MQISQKNLSYLLNSILSEWIKTHKKEKPGRKLIVDLFSKVLPKKGYITQLAEAENVILVKPLISELLSIGRAQEGPRLKFAVSSGESWFANMELNDKGQKMIVLSLPVGNRGDYMDREDYDRLDANVDYDINIFTREVIVDVRVDS